MHLYKIVAQISLIIYIFNLVLAAPIGVDGTVVAEGAAAMPKEQDSEAAASDRSTSSPSFQDAMGSPQHSPPPSSDGSTFSGHPTPLVSSDESVSDYAWLLDRPQRLNLNPPASLASPHLSDPGPSRITLPWQLQGSATEHPPSPQSAASSEVPFLSASDGSLSSHYFSASDGLPSSPHSIPEGLAPLHHLTSDGSPPLPPPSPTGTHPDSGEFFNEDVVRGLKIVAGVVVVGTVIAGAIGGIVGSQIKHRDFQDS